MMIQYQSINNVSPCFISSREYQIQFMDYVFLAVTPVPNYNDNCTYINSLHP